MYIEIDKSRNSSRFNVRMPYRYGGMNHCYAVPLSLYPPMPYSKASDHSVTIGITNTMLFIGIPLAVTHWRVFI